MTSAFEIEAAIDRLSSELDNLMIQSKHHSGNFEDEIKLVKNQLDSVWSSYCTHLDAHQVLMLARHPQRPQGLDYIQACFDDFEMLQGDRHSGDCSALISGIATLNNKSVMVFAQQKGRTTEERLKHNFGMVKPKGYRKAKRLMALAERYAMPVITFLDSPGADAGVDAEMANQSEAIATNMLLMSELRVPIVSVVIGEAMSGGAMALGVADHVCMLEYAVYSVISPEGCASILWRSADYAKQAAEAMCITSESLLEKRLIDAVIPEPLGGAQRDYPLTTSRVKKHIIKVLDALSSCEVEHLLAQRYRKWMLSDLVE
tara:strand:- start:458 stop:1408 length:951 start_codon:yes stop_codon:yes gene_type:complete